MPKPTRVASILLRCLLALSACVAVAVVAVYVLSEARLKREYPVAVSLARPDAALAGEGRQLARSRGCADCHADDFGGKVLIDQMPFARIVGSNLTQAAKGQARVSNHERMYRALHHGVDVDSRPLPMMPSAEFASLSAREIEALSAYLDTVPRVERELPDSALGPIARGMLVAGKLEGFLSAEVIDHRTPAIAVPPPPGTLAYGRHVAQLCTGCHGADFGGGPDVARRSRCASGSEPDAACAGPGALERNGFPDRVAHRHAAGRHRDRRPIHAVARSRASLGRRTAFAMALPAQLAAGRAQCRHTALMTAPISGRKARSAHASALHQ